MSALTRFWIQLEMPRNTPRLQTFFGVTAFGLDDAKGLLSSEIFGEMTLPAIVSCKENFDVDELDQNHVVPNMGVVARRGIWWPRVNI